MADPAERVDSADLVQRDELADPAQRRESPVTVEREEAADTSEGDEGGESVKEMLQEVIARLQVLDENVDYVKEEMDNINSSIVDLDNRIEQLIRQAQEGPLYVDSTSEDEKE